MVKKLTIIQAFIPFLEKPAEKLHLSDIARNLNEQHTTVRLWLNELAGLGLLKMEHKGRLTLYCLNYAHPNMIDYLVIAEKTKLLSRCKDELLLRELIFLLRQEFQDAEAMIVFGSATHSIKTANDVDLLLAGKMDPKTIRKVSSKINKELHVISINSFTEISEALKAEIIRKHLIIDGTEAYLRWILGDLRGAGGRKTA